MASKVIAVAWLSTAVVAAAGLGVGVDQLLAPAGSSSAQPTSPTLGGGSITSSANKGSNAGHPITLSGDVVGTVGLGSPATLNVTISNPNNQDIVVTRVSGTITSVTTAGISGLPACASNWYSVGTFNGSRPIAKNGRGVVSVPIVLTNLASTNQDNCKGSTVSFSFNAEARQA